MVKDTVLLLTSCINPNGMKFTVLQNKEERKKQYIEAIKFYLANTKFKIVFCDNSGEDLSELKTVEGKGRVEILSFKGNVFDKSLGKGYGEFGIVQYAITNSRFIREASLVIKLTGRLVVDNICEVLKVNRWLLLNPRKFVFATLIMEQKAFDSRCFFASKDFFLHYFVNQPNVINDSKNYYFEHYLYDIIKNLHEDYVVSDFVMPLSINGVSGSTGIVYSSKDLSFGDKLNRVRDYCEYRKKAIKEDKCIMYLHLSFVSAIIRIIKAVFKRVS